MQLARKGVRVAVSARTEIDARETGAELAVSIDVARWDSVERGVAVVPAGSLDTNPGIEPAAHIFVASKAAWDRITDSLPQFDAMPPRN
mgnify:CR=1 FL=1